MKVTPLKRYRVPRYPIQEILATHPELLKLVPKRWANTPLVLSALSLVCMILAARDGRPADKQANMVKASPPTVQSQPAATRVAPIFHHGEGRGAFGCVVTSPPVFLTEDEARQVIIEEAATAGIHFENTKRVIAPVEVPVTDAYLGLAIDVRTRKPKTQKSALVLEGTDPQRNISFEFVSYKDVVDTWEIGAHIEMSTLSLFKIEPAAEILQQGLGKTTADQTIGVFYDPASDYVSDKLTPYPVSGNSKEEAKQKSIQELREQVRDFIVWLKAQGII
jgi:hypothetical protein